MGMKVKTLRPTFSHLKSNKMQIKTKMLLKSNNKEFLVESCLIAKQPTVKRKVMINQSFTRPGAKIYKIVVIFK